MSSSDPVPHPEAAALLFYLSGTLESDEARAVEHHLAECAECREERARCERLRTAVRDAVAATPGPPPELLARVRARLAEAEGSARLAAPRRSGWRTALSEIAPRRPLAAAALLAMVQTGLVVGVAGLAYRAGQRGAVTLSSPAPAADESAFRIRVAFDDEAPASSIRTLLESLGARIVDGPSAAGFYLVAFPKIADPEAARSKLEGSPLVRFAERVE